VRPKSCILGGQSWLLSVAQDGGFIYLSKYHCFFRKVQRFRTQTLELYSLSSNPSLVTSFGDCGQIILIPHAAVFSSRKWSNMSNCHSSCCEELLNCLHWQGCSP
jgi:hypothetical protein